jgi:hypothetical protein
MRHAAIVSLCLLAACVPLPGNRELASKRVVGFRESSIAVADDNTICRLSQPQAAKVRVGQNLRCIWEHDGTSSASWKGRSARATPAVGPFRR